MQRFLIAATQRMMSSMQAKELQGHAMGVWDMELIARRCMHLAKWVRVGQIRRSNMLPPPTSAARLTHPLRT